MKTKHIVAAFHSKTGIIHPLLIVNTISEAFEKEEEFDTWRYAIIKKYFDINLNLKPEFENSFENRSTFLEENPLPFGKGNLPISDPKDLVHYYIALYKDIEFIGE